MGDLSSLPVGPVDLFAQQAANRRRSVLTVAGFIAFFAWLGFGGDWILYASTRFAGPGHYHHGVPLVGLTLTVLAGALAWYASTAGADRVLWASGAWELLTPATDQQRQLVNVVAEMAVAAGTPCPRIHILTDNAPNAFATGRDVEHSHIVVTQGLLDLLTRDELQGVVAHEFGHIKNMDVRLMTLLAALVGAVALVNDAMWQVIRGRGERIVAVTGGERSADARRKSGVDARLLAIAVVVWAVSWLLAPMIVRLLALGVSRSREYLADTMAAQFTRNPLALASALEKIAAAPPRQSAIGGGLAHLCIADPLGRRMGFVDGWVADLLATHPPMAMRVARLKAMGYQAMKRAGTYPSPFGGETARVAL